MSRRARVAGAAVVVVAGALLAPAGPATAQGAALAAAAPASPSITGVTRALGATSTVAFRPGTAGSVGRPTTNEIAEEPLEEGDLGSDGDSARRATASGPVTGEPSPYSGPRRVRPGTLEKATRLAAPKEGITRTGARLVDGFDGLNHRDSRTAAGGNQFSTEPPDQALCVGNGHVVEAVNNAVRVDTTDGARGGVMSLNAFFGLPVAIDRAAGTFGPQTTDPTCVFDPSSGTFYVVDLSISTDPATGERTGANYLDIAVSQDPTGAWRVHRLPVTDDGSEGTPVRPNCPCLGDYPHVGFDAHGFYITTNEFPFSGGFNSAQVYAFDKTALATGADTIYVTQFDTAGADGANPGFTVWPAQSPSAADFALGAGGTEYFLSSNAVFDDEGASEEILVWSLTGTSTLGRPDPTARLNVAPVPVQPYAVPPTAPQKAGPAPLLECLNTADCRTGVLGLEAEGPTETLSRLDASDSRMQQVVYARGRLYGALDTAVDLGGETQAGIAWYAVRPGTTRREVSGRIIDEGQFGVPGNAVTYPAVGVTSKGRGVIGFTLTGRDYHPSAAFAGLDSSGVGPVQVAALGKGPQDGFSGYQAYTDGNVSRWGDYGAASVDGDDVWIASEYIAQSCTLEEYLTPPVGSCAGTRTALANWGTRISRIRP